MQNVNIRKLALESLLLIINENNSASNVTLEVLDKYDFLDAKDKGFYQRLVYGMLERRVYLDEIIGLLSTTKVKKLKPVIRLILEMGAYEISFMDAVPNYAACDEYVKLAAKKGFSSLRGFVNAILRGVSEARYDESKLSEAAKLSIPQWLYDKWCAELGTDITSNVCKAFLAEHKTWIKVNTRLISTEDLANALQAHGIFVDRDANLPEALSISGFGNIASLKEFKEGKFYVMDKASQSAMQFGLNGIAKGSSVLDICAAPGGKSICAAMCDEVASVESRDLSDMKVSKILDNIDRLKLTDKMTAKVWDATVLDEDSIGKYDLVICDVPCLGLGDIGRKPDILLRASLENLGSLVDLQRRIIANAVKYVKAGGRIIYSTCSITKEENQENAAYLLSLDSSLCEVTQRLILPDGSCDGFFVSVFDKR